jgi:uncharacterized protein (TIGR03000 family)
MYSMVLMMALTTGGDTPALGHRGGGCCGCYGGGGGRHHGGGGCCGCYGGGYAYGGCYGGGGWGGCYGGGWGGGYGGCYGGGGYISGGCYGGMGMGYGSGIISGGCYGGGTMMYGGGMIMPGAGVQPGTGTGTGGEKLKTNPRSKETEVLAPTPATIVVELPADAKLSIDGEATTSTGSSRVFTSPELQPGREYHYTLKAEVVRDGKPVVVEQTVAVKAGQPTPVTLTLPASSVAQR